MRDHEHAKILRDTQVYKDKCDSAMLQLKQNERQMADLLATRSLCEDIMEKEATRAEQEANETRLREKRQAREWCSFDGHVKF